MPNNPEPPGYQPQRKTPLEMARHYGFPVDEYDGSGQKVAVLSLQEFVSTGELAADLAKLGIDASNIRNKAVDCMEDPGDTDYRGIFNATGESHLDLEVIASICPKAEITIYTCPGNFRAWNDLADAAVADGNKVISVSYGLSEESGFVDLGEGFERAAKAGVTVLIASGDDGSRNRTNNGRANANFPSSSPFVLACGGTQIDGAGNEVVWNLNLNGQYGAGGGGVSELYDRPCWQKDAAANICSANRGGGSGRVLPDVAGLAAPDDWIIIMEDGTARAYVGGTSAVTPMWAAFFTLVNQARAAAGKGAIGFVNEKLYGLPSKDSCFNDITQGNNKPAPGYPGYDAATGFDACSGWGSPKGDALFKALVDMD